MKASSDISPSIFPLTPTQEAKDFLVYKSRLDVAFKIRDVRNIAVTGKFGAGKSSILKTYFYRKKVLWVTLAPFIEYANSLPQGGGRPKRDKLARLLEVSVLKQLFYTASRSELPFSRFARIVHNNLRTYLLASFTVISFLMVLLFAWQPDFIWAQLKSVATSQRERLSILGLIFGVVPMTIIIMGACDFFRSRRFYGKLNAACAEVEVGASGKDMSFNRTIDEIIYHFQRIKYMAVVFEDVDRFTEPIIFAKLKEMNHIINESRDIREKNKPIRFVYALRDMTLSDEQRVKFFDYILPIVPITSIANSEEHFAGLLAKCLGVDKVDDQYARIIHTTSQYIVDARLIRNICNEFSVYKEQLDPDLPGVNLLGMTIFKNVLPKEYENLLRGGGVVVDLLKMAESIIESKQAAIDAEITVAETELASLDPDVDADRVVALKKENAVRRAQRVKWGRQNFRSLLRNKHISREKMLREVGFQLDSSKRRYVPLGDLEPTLDTRQIDVLLALFSGGYIDENYKHYLSKFDDAIISGRDHKFVLSVMRDSPLECQYRIDSIENVRTELGTWFYERLSILNYDLVYSAWFDPGWPEDKREVLLGYVFNGDGQNIVFVDGFLKWGGDKQKLYEKLAKLTRRFQPSYCGAMVSNEGIKDQRKLRQIGHLLKAEKDVSKVAISQKVSEFLLSFPAVGTMFMDMGFVEDEVRQLLSGGYLRFVNIDFNEDSSILDPVLRAVIDTDAYELEPVLLKGLLQKTGRNVDDWARSPGSVAFGCTNEKIRRRLDLDLGAFLENVYFKDMRKCDDGQVFIEFVLNHMSLDADAKKKFLDCQIRGIANARRIKESSIIAYAMESDKLIPSWENVVGYYEMFIKSADLFEDGAQVDDADEFRKMLCGYLARYRSYFENAKFDVDYELDYILLALFFGSPELHDEFVRRLIKNCPVLHDRVYLEDSISPRRILWLAKRKMTVFNHEDYVRLREKGNMSYVAYACMHLDAFIASAKNEGLSANELRMIFESEYLDSSGAIALAKAFDEIILEDEDVQRALARFITIGRLAQFDNKIVCKCFDQLSPVAVQCYVISIYNFDRKNSIKAVKLMPQPFRSLIQWGMAVDVPRSPIVKDMLGKLKAVGLVISFRITGAYYRVHVAASDGLRSA